MCPASSRSVPRVQHGAAAERQHAVVAGERRRRPRPARARGTPARRPRRRCRRSCGRPPPRRPRRCRAAAARAATRPARPTVVLPDPGRPDEHDRARVGAHHQRAQRRRGSRRGSRVVAGGLGDASRRRTSPGRPRPAPARPSPRRRRRRPARRTRRSAGGSPWPARPMATSTVSSARGTVEIGFIAARTRSTSPVRHAALGAAGAAGAAADDAVGVALHLVVRRPSPRRAAVRNPSPTSTPLIAWMPISAPASRASSRRSQCTCEPRPGGSP